MTSSLNGSYSFHDFCLSMQNAIFSLSLSFLAIGRISALFFCPMLFVLFFHSMSSFYVFAFCLGLLLCFKTLLYTFALCFCSILLLYAFALCLMFMPCSLALCLSTVLCSLLQLCFLAPCICSMLSPRSFRSMYTSCNLMFILFHVCFTQHSVLCLSLEVRAALSCWYHNYTKALAKNQPIHHN